MERVVSKAGFIGIFAIAFGLACACSKDPDSGNKPTEEEDNGEVDKSGVSAIPGATLTPAAVDPARACAAASDCVHPVFLPPVDDSATCSCPRCPVTDGSVAPMNKTTQAAYRKQWEAKCLEWATALPCPPTPCSVNDNLACEEGQCTVR